MSRNPTSPVGAGGSGLSGFLSRVGRNLIDHAISNATTAAGGGNGGGVVGSRSFFSLGSDNTDGSGAAVIEYTGRSANSEIAEIYPIQSRCGSMVLHGPCKEAGSRTYPLFNIILHTTDSTGTSERMFSLYRTESEADAGRIFVVYKEVFPDLVKASQHPLDKNTLEKIVKLLKNNESYSAAHVAAALSMVDQLKSPVLRKNFADQEGNLLHTPLHVAVVHGKMEAFREIASDDQTFSRVYDYQDLKGNTLVHLAASCKDKAVGAAVLTYLREWLQLQSGPQRASANRMLFEMFLKTNKDGNASIHLACMNYNKEALEELTSVADAPSPSTPSTPTTNTIYTSILDLKTVSTGDTPLHLATSNNQMMSHLLELGSDPNMVDNNGVTPLHKTVQEANLKSTLQLLANNAFPNFTATFNSHVDATPLHVAAATCAIDCLKALIVFGADIEMKNRYGHTARHIVASVFAGGIGLKQDALFVLAAAGAKRCDPSVSGCAEGCRAGGKSDGKKPDDWKISRDGTTPPGSSTGLDGGTLVHEAMRGLSIVKESLEASMKDQDRLDTAASQPVIGGRLLALDGGGIRGLVLTQMLFFMEKEFGNGTPIITYFDWVAGTSTGGILALALSCGKSILETQSLYMKLKDKVFTGDRPYSAARMEEFLKREFGPERKMSSIQKPRVMIMTSLANRRPPDLYIFRNYMSPRCLVGDNEEYTQFPDDTYVWETAKVTGAAPSYFTLDNAMFIDGGLISNNPTLDALSELVQFKAVMSNQQAAEWKLPSLVLSLGTGIPPRIHCDATDLDIAWPTGVIDAIRNVPRLSQLVNLLVDQATQAEGQVVERARAWCTSIGIPYFRFSPEMSADIGLDEKQDEVLINLMWETWCYMVGNRNVIREIFERLSDLDIGRSRNQVHTMEMD